MTRFPDHSDLPSDPHERAKRIDEILEAEGGGHRPLSSGGAATVFFGANPTVAPTEPGQPVSLYVDPGRWTDDEDPPEFFRTVTGPVNFNRRRQIWVAKETTWRRCINEDRLPSTKGHTTEAAPWPIEHVAVVGDTEHIPDHILHPPKRRRAAKKSRQEGDT